MPSNQTLLVRFVYEHGRFTPADTEIVVALLRVMSFAVPGWILQQIAVRAFFARGDTWRPMLLATAVALLAIPLYLALGSRFGAAGVAAAGVIAISGNDEIWIDRREVEPRGLRTHIERLHLENPKGSIVIQADENSTNETLVQVMEAAKAVGVTNVAYQIFTPL